MYEITKYIFLINFTKFNKVSYFIFLNILVLFIALSAIFFVMASIKLNRNGNHQLPVWITSVLTFIIPLISRSFFGQIFHSLLTIFYCSETDRSFYSESEQCLQGIWFKIEAILCSIAIAFLFFIAYVTNCVFYIPMCLKGKNKKIHSLNDVILLFTKIILNVLFSALKNEKDTHAILILCNLVTGFNFYSLTTYQGYSNQNLAFANTYLSLILFWGFICLFIGKLIKDLIVFNGTIYLFFIGFVLLFIQTYYKSKIKKELYNIDRDKITSYIEYYKYIIELQTLIEKKDDSRENKIALKSLLMKIEENCTQPFCFLKRYLNCLAEGKDLDILLYYYMQKAFEDGLNKFNHNITITISYIYFLLKRLSKKKKAFILFKSIDKNIYSIDDLFNIYRCEQIVESLWTGFDGKNKENIESVDLIKLFDYQNNVKEFKQLLNKISLLYYDFWLALFSNNCEGKEQFKQLNDIGTKINKLLYQIENYFELILSIKNDDVDILKLYSLYLKNILNDEEKYMKYHSMLINISIDFNFKIKEVDYSSYDLNYLLTEKKDLEYLIISAEDKDKNERKILNMSIGLSTIIGYQPHEIIGKDMNILVPKLFHKVHNSMLKKLIAKRKLDLYQTLSKNLKYYPEKTSKTIYCKTKSHFLKSLQFDANLVQTEDGKHIYIILINRKTSFPNSWNEEGEAPPCCVLTDKNFIVQTFTADCCDLLGFNSSVINSNFEITSCILQFNEDVKNFQENSGFRAGGNSTYLFEYSEVLSSSTHGHGNHLKKGTKKPQKNVNTNSLSRNNSSNKINNLLRPFHHVSDTINLMKNKFKRQLIKTKYNSTQIITWKLKDDTNDSKSDNSYVESKFELSVKECKISNITVGYYFLFKKVRLVKRGATNEEINYYKQYVSNTIEDEGSADNKSKEDKKNSSHLSSNSKVMNKSNTEYVNPKSGFYISQQILNKGKRNESRNNIEEVKSPGSKRISGVSEEDSKNFSFYLISGVKDENVQNDYKVEKEILLNNQMLEKEREKKEKESLRFQKIEGSYVPKNCISFDFDIRSKSFLPNRKVISKRNKGGENPLAADLLVFYKKQLSDLQRAQKKKDNESEINKSESSPNLSETSESGTSSKSYEETEKEEEKESNEKKSNDMKTFTNRKKTIKNTKLILNEMPPPAKTHEKNTPKYSLKKTGNEHNNNYVEQYYKIKFNKIRFFHYDFYKDMVVEDKQFEKKSNMENLISESKNANLNFDKLHNYFLNNKELEYSNMHKVENKLKVQKLEGRHNSSKKGSKNIFDDNKSTLSDNEEEFKIKIKESLNKEDKQKSIEVFFILSLIIFALLIALGIFFNYEIINDIEKNQENIVLICYSAMLRTLYNGVSYFLREFTLVNFLMPNITNNVNYTDYPVYQNDRTKYLEFMKEKLKSYYIESNDILLLLSSYDIKISDNASYILNNKELIIFALTENLGVYKMNSTFIVSLIELNSALYSIVTSNGSLTQNNNDVYIFIYNYQNEVGKGIRDQVDIFINELYTNMKDKKFSIIISMIIIGVLLIIFFIILFISYRIIIKKKSSYIEGFYEIKLPFIRESIKNCEQFIYILKKQKREEESGVEYEKSSESLRNDSNMDNQIEEEEKSYNKMSKNMNENYYKNNKNNLSNQTNNRDTLSIIIFSVLIILYFLILFVFCIISYISYHQFSNNATNYCTFLFHLQRIMNNYMEFYNGYREYLFNDDSIVNGQNCKTFIQTKSTEIFSTRGNDSFVINTMYDKIKNFKKTYEEFSTQSLCSRREEGYFDNDTHCETFLDGQIKYGYAITAYTLLDLTRMGFNYVKYFYLEDKNVVGNLYEFGKHEYIIQDNETFRLQMFNEKTIHTNLNIIFLHALFPYYLGIVNLTSNAIQDAVKSVDDVYLILVICYIVFNIILFLTIWVPFIKNMNSIIYNAKKILGIIPIHILSTLSNIKKILDLKNMN